MTEIEYWFIERAVLGRCRFFPDPDDVNYSQGIKYTEDDIAQEGIKLIESGDIEVSLITKKGGRNQWIPEQHLTFDQIKLAVRNELWAEYRITKQSGEKWENISSVNWNLFYTIRSNWRERKAEVTALDIELIKEILVHFWYRGALAIEDTLEWDVVEPWVVTYWKTLPKANKVSFDYEDDARNKIIRGVRNKPSSNRNLVAIPQSTPEFWSYLNNNWYKSPFAS